MKTVIYVMLTLLAYSLPAVAQLGKFGREDLEFSGGYEHISGDQGLDGYRVGMGWNPIPQFQLHLTYDGVYDNSTIGTFEFTSVGSTFTNSHLQEIMVGPRYFLPGAFKNHGRIKGNVLVPFVDASFGETRLHSTISNSAIGEINSADTAFSWGIGGGVDYRIYPHWAIRSNLGFLRTHFGNSGQGRVTLGLGVVWSIRQRAQ